MSGLEAQLQQVVIGLVRSYLSESVEDGLEASTVELAERLAKVGKDHGCTTSGRHLRDWEYLLDYCWTRSGEDDLDWNCHTGLVLAAELEWGGTRDAVWRDFIKLADVQASGRLFVASLAKAAWSQIRDAGRGELHQDFCSFWGNHRFLRPGDWVVLCLIPKGRAVEDDPEIHLLVRGERAATSQRVSV